MYALSQHLPGDGIRKHHAGYVIVVINMNALNCVSFHVVVT